VAWFTIAAILGRPITIYGDGKQSRDVLHVADLASAYDAAFERRDSVSGQAFNIGGGPNNRLSLLELIQLLERELKFSVPFKYGDWRPGDQPVFVCALDKAQRLLGWRPTIPAQQGIGQLVQWVRENRKLFNWLRDESRVRA
jgi:CDP-paratose 2-epimerase